MIAGQGQACDLEKERIEQRHPAAADQDMECPTGFHLIGIWLGIEDVGMNQLPAQQTQEPAPDQSDIDAAGDAGLGGVSFGDVHQHGTDDAAEKRPG